MTTPAGCASWSQTTATKYNVRSLDGAEALKALRDAGHAFPFVILTATVRNPRDLSTGGALRCPQCRCPPRAGGRGAIGRGWRDLHLAEGHRAQILVK